MEKRGKKGGVAGGGKCSIFQVYLKFVCSTQGILGKVRYGKERVVDGKREFCNTHGTYIPYLTLPYISILTWIDR